jgi:hypothetical protein
VTARKRKARTNDLQIVIRVPAEVEHRAERLKPALERLHAGLRVSTSAVYRIALLAGLDALDERHRR